MDSGDNHHQGASHAQNAAGHFVERIVSMAKPPPRASHSNHKCVAGIGIRVTNFDPNRLSHIIQKNWKTRR
jgi:hypothetical protein